MENFEKSDIITEVAFNKNKSRFLPRHEQMHINTVLKNKMVRFLDEMKSESGRPVNMSLFDQMMNDMHGQRIKDLYEYRRQGNHVVALLCSSVPPELIYGIFNHIPVSVCMGAGEVEKFGNEFTQGMCPPTRSMVGFLMTGMCVFFNLADYILASDYSPAIKKTVTIINKISNDFGVYCIESKDEPNGKISIDYTELEKWVLSISNGHGFHRERFIEYCNLYSEIRIVYKSIFDLRKVANPPIDGKNSLWIQQFFLVEEPNKLLSSLNSLKSELEERVKVNVGYNSTGKKKRVMLVTPRIMPPFTEIYRLIESCGAIIVCEISDMGISNINYDLAELMDLVNRNNTVGEEAIRYLLESIDKTESSCFKEFDYEKVIRNIEEYDVEAVLNFTFPDSPEMEYKTNRINELLIESGINSMVMKAGYLELYEGEEEFTALINGFLGS
jgi:benzoyl-CoA reductase/2-hydroxyglutaryl-CoA dehydratase subunit BcrC/BadD/HgdB